MQHFQSQKEEEKRPLVCLQDHLFSSSNINFIHAWLLSIPQSLSKWDRLWLEEKMINRRRKALLYPPPLCLYPHLLLRTHATVRKKESSRFSSLSLSLLYLQKAVT